jgi:hypothetical protein
MTKKLKVPTDADMRRAIDKGSVAAVQRIIDAGYDLEERFVTDTTFDRDCVGKTALIWAVDLQRDKIVAQLLQGGADINGRDRVGQTALHFAATQKPSKMLILLIAAGADVHAMQVGMQTPLHYAIDSDRWSHCDMLLDAGADPGFLPVEATRLWKPGYLTPFQSAIDNERFDLVEKFAHVGGSALFKQKILNGRALADLCRTDSMREQLLALRTDVELGGAIGAGAESRAASTPRTMGLRPL